MIIFKTCQGLENFYIKFQDFSYFSSICTNPAFNNMTNAALKHYKLHYASTTAQFHDLNYASSLALYHKPPALSIPLSCNVNSIFLQLYLKTCSSESAFTTSWLLSWRQTQVFYQATQCTASENHAIDDEHVAQRTQQTSLYTKIHITSTDSTDNRLKIFIKIYKYWLKKHIQSINIFNESINHQSIISQ